MMATQRDVYYGRANAKKPLAKQKTVVKAPKLAVAAPVKRSNSLGLAKGKK
jgi:hypothetical protein